MTGRVHELSDDTFEAEVLHEPSLTLVDFYADWCGPCRTVAPIVEALARDYSGRLKVARIDTEEHETTFDRYGLESLPTLLFFYGGQAIGEIVGAKPQPEIEAEVKRLLKAVRKGSQGMV